MLLLSQTSLIIRNEQHTNCIEVEVINEEDYYVSSFEIAVHVKTKNLECHFLGFWIEREQIRLFIEELRKLGETRKGSATLSDISSNDFCLQIEAIDGWGHLGTTIRIEKKGYSDSEYLSNTIIQTGFEIDPSSIPTIVAELKKWSAKN